MHPLNSGPAPASGSVDAPPPGLTGLVRARMLDGELAALLWVLLDVRTPVVVVGLPGSGRRTVVEALAGALPPAAVVFEVAGDDEFVWLPQAGALGWHAERPMGAEGPTGAEPPTGAEGAAGAGSPADPASAVLLVRDLADPGAGGPGGGRTRVLLRALSLGYGMLATAPGDGLDDLVERLHSPTIGTDENERSRLGVVLVMAPPAEGRGARLAAAHYVRPVALDTHGHVQRLPPAVLATWSEGADRWEHFAWGVMDDLAGRTGRSPRDVEREQARRAASLAR